MQDNSPVRSFQSGGQVFDIPITEVDSFLEDMPGASEVMSFTAGKDTLDIPFEKVQDFLKDMPDAKPLRSYGGFTQPKSIQYNGERFATPEMYQQSQVNLSGQQAKFNPDDIIEAKSMIPVIQGMKETAAKSATQIPNRLLPNNPELEKLYPKPKEQLGYSEPEVFGQSRQQYITNDILDKTEGYYKAIADGDSNAAVRFVNGLKTIDLSNLVTVGIKGMAEDIDIYGAAKRYSENKATPEDKNLLVAKAMLEEVQSKSQNDRATSIGVGLADMAPWLAQFALSGGIGSSATKATEKALESVMAKNMMGKVTGKILSGIAGTAAQTAVQIPMNVGGTAQRMTDKYAVSPEGKLTQYSVGEGLGEAAYKILGNNFLETYSERVFGDAVDKVGTIGLSKALDSKLLAGTKVKDIINSVRNNKWLKTTNRTLGLNTPLTENIEEAFTGLTQPLVTEDGMDAKEKAIKEYFTKENLIRTFLTTSVMGASAGAIQAPGEIYRNVKSDQGKKIVDKFDQDGKDLWNTATTAETIEDRKDAFVDLWDYSIENGVDESGLNSIMHYYQTALSENEEVEPMQQRGPIQETKQITPDPEQERQAMIQQETDYLDAIAHESGHIVELTDMKGNIMYAKSGDLNDNDKIITVAKEGPSQNGKPSFEIEVFPKTMIKDWAVFSKDYLLNKRIANVDEILNKKTNSQDLKEGDKIKYKDNNYLITDDLGDSYGLFNKDTGDVLSVPKTEAIQKADQQQEIQAQGTAQPKERKVITQAFGNTSIDIARDNGFDEVVPTDKVPLEKALPILEKKLKDNKKFELKVEKSEVENRIHGETIFDDDIIEKETVIKSIRIVPKQAEQNNVDTPVNNVDTSISELTNKQKAYSVITGKQELSETDKQESDVIPENVANKIISGTVSPEEIEAYKVILNKGSQEIKSGKQNKKYSGAKIQKTTEPNNNIYSLEEEPGKGAGNNVGKQAEYGRQNAIFTEDVKNSALARLKTKRGQLNSGIDPQEMIDAITVAGYHIEAGARKFADFSKAMIEDVGEWIKPYLKSIYESVRRWPEMNDVIKDMDNTQFVDKSDIDQLIRPQAEIPVNSQNVENVGNADEFDNLFDLSNTEDNISSNELSDQENKPEQTKKVNPRKVRSSIDRFRSKLQDSTMAIKNLISKFDLQVKDFSNVYYALNQKGSRSMGRMKYFINDFFDPIGNTIAKIEKETGKSYEEITRYLLARHAPERNESFRKRGKRGEVFAGMSDEEAIKYYTQFENNVPAELTNELWAKIRKATERISKYWVEYGRFTNESLSNITDMGWNYYVPMRGWEPIADDIDLDYEYTGKGTDYTGNERTEGRTSMADDPIAYIFQMANSAILWGENNRVKRIAYNLVNTNKSRKELFEISRVHFMKDKNGLESEVILEPSGTIEDPNGTKKPDFMVSRFDGIDNEGNISVTPIGLKSDLENENSFSTVHSVDYLKRKPLSLSKQHEVDLFINGSSFKIIFKDPAIANTINGLNLAKRVRGLADVTRFRSMVVTSLNPAFTIRNTYRDFQTAAKTVFIEKGFKTSMKFAAKYGVAAKFLASETILKSEPKTEEEIKWKKWFDEYNLNGGPTGHAYLLPLEEVKSNVKKHIKRLKRGKIGKTANYVNPVHLFEAVKMMSEYGESIARFTAYVMARERGESIPTAVNDAKEITVNFDTKGEWAPMIGSFVMFYNASTQGIRRQLNLAKNHPLRYFVANASMLAAQGYLLRLLWDLMNPDDDDKDYQEVSKYSRYNNSVIGWKDYYAVIPLPQGYRVWNALGAIMYDMQHGLTDAEDASVDIAEVFSQAVSPVNVNDMFTKEGELSIEKIMGTLFSPLQPFTDVRANEDFRDNTIYKEPFLNTDNSFARSQMYKYNVNYFIKQMTDKIFIRGGGDPSINSRYVGGTEVSSWMDWNPSKIEFVTKSYTGGPGSLLLDGANLLALQIWDETIKESGNKEYKVDGFDPSVYPILNSFLRKKYEGKYSNEYRDIVNVANNLKTEYSKRLKVDNDGNLKLFTDDQVIFMEDVIRAHKRIGELIDRKDRTDDPIKKAAIEVSILSKQKDIVSRFSNYDESGKPITKK